MELNYDINQGYIYTSSFLIIDYDKIILFLKGGNSQSLTFNFPSYDGVK